MQKNKNVMEINFLVELVSCHPHHHAKNPDYVTSTNSVYCFRYNILNIK